MPRSILMGRVQKPGEPLFLEEDTDGAMALAEEERDACPKCGWPKSWCQAIEHQFSFEPVEAVCWLTKRLAEHQSSTKWTGKHEDTQRATSLSAKFRDGQDPDMGAGLDLPDGEVDELPVVAGVAHLAGEGAS